MNSFLPCAYSPTRSLSYRIQFLHRTGESIFKKLCKWEQSSVKGPWKCPSNRTLMSKRVSVPFEDHVWQIEFDEKKFYIVFYYKLYLGWRSLNISGGCYLKGLSGMEGDPAMPWFLTSLRLVFNWKWTWLPLPVRAKWDAESPLKARSVRFNMVLGFRVSKWSPLLSEYHPSTQQNREQPNDSIRSLLGSYRLSGSTYQVKMVCK